MGMDLKEIGINTRNLFDSVQYKDYWRALVNAALNLRISEAMEIVCYPLHYLDKRKIFVYFFCRSTNLVTIID